MASGHAAAPQTILGAHVLVKLTLTALTMALTVLAGKRFFRSTRDSPVRIFHGAAGSAVILSNRFSDRDFCLSALRATNRSGHPCIRVIGVCGIVRAGTVVAADFKSWRALLPLTYAVSLLEGS